MKRLLPSILHLGHLFVLVPARLPADKSQPGNFLTSGLYD